MVSRGETREDSRAKGERDAAVLGAEGHRVQDALTWAGQRTVNIMWESTQRNIALAVMGVYLLICFQVALSQTLRGEKVDLPPSLTGVVGFVVGAYFNRTNHEKTGGVGRKPHAEPYEGR